MRSQRMWKWSMYVQLCTFQASPVPSNLPLISPSQSQQAQVIVFHMYIILTSTVIRGMAELSILSSQSTTLVCMTLHMCTILLPMPISPTVLLTSPTDFGVVSTLLMFDSCTTQLCTDINISNSTGLDQSESFFINLQRTPDLDPRITLNPVVGEIEITKNNGLWIHYIVQNHITDCRTQFSKSV